RKRELARVDVAVGGEEGRAENTLGGHRRKHAPCLVGRDELERQTECLGPRGLARQLLHTLLARGKAKGANLVPTGLEPDLVLEGSVEVDRVHHHLGQAQRSAELSNQTRGVKGRTAGDPRALEQDQVSPAETREPVEDGRAADTASDDDGARVTPQTLSRRVPRPWRRQSPALAAARRPSRRRPQPGLPQASPRTGGCSQSVRGWEGSAGCSRA